MSSSQHESTLFAGESEMHRRVRALDWAATSVGPVQSWPQSLRATIKTLLGSRYPMILLWGPELIQIYNEAYIGLIGDKHPGALGRSIRETQAESWEVIGPMIHEVMSTGAPNWVPAQMLPLERSGYREESYFSLSYSAVEDDGGRITGMLCVCSEVTQQVLAERRTRLLRDLALRAGEIRSVETTCSDIAAAMAEHPLDVPFALLYLRELDGDTLVLRGAVGIEPGTEASPRSITLGNEQPVPWPLARALSGETVAARGLDARLSVCGGPWKDVVRSARVMPIASAEPGVFLGVLVAGLSPNRALDEGYASFYDLLVSQVSVALRNARAYEDQRKRAEALAELDRAKTAFFSNVSHEFRTPLTLILGPLEDALAEAASLPEAQRQRLELVRRNSLRLFKLVNTLLDFSRIESGRINARYEPTDLAQVTRELASLFRAAAERAGLALDIDAPPLSEPVYVDREMWEKIVLNLLSNALKFTFEGGISVSLRRAGGAVRLEVRDTGTGIPPEELSQVFQRFHRVRGAQARSHEGSGIGLALVQELARLHGGSAAVESVVGKGSTFSVTIPLGAAHLPRARVAADAERPAAQMAAPFVEEAMRWLPEAPESAPARLAPPPPGEHAAPRIALLSRPRILLADDNADLRDYVAGLLRPSYAVETVSDGEAALQAVRARRPDVVLSDVMMPRLDGFGLLRELRADPKTRDVPLILLSARAGEESTVEGLSAGADDYLVKPFSARELLARVKVRLEMDAMRREVIAKEQALRAAKVQQEWTQAILDSSPLPLLLLEPATGRVIFANKAADVMAGGELVRGVPVDAYHLAYRLTDADDRPIPNDRWPAARAARGETVRGAEVVWHTSLARFSLLVNSETIPAVHGHPATVVLALQDVSRLKNIEAELRSAVRARDEFLAIASHELRTPLTTLKLQLDVLHRGWERSGTGETDGRKALEKLEVATRQADRLVSLVDALLNVSAISTRSFRLDRERFDLAAFVREVVASFAAQARRANVSFELRLPGEAEGFWDKARVGQALASLLSNALKYGPGKPVHVRLLAAADRVALSVQDRGIGIPAGDLERIFGRFERAVSSSHYGGLGLGLYIASEIVGAHGGTIQVESAPGRGATFTMVLPRFGVELPHPRRAESGLSP